MDHCFELPVHCTPFDHQKLTATIQRAPGINSNHPEATKNQQQPSTAHQQYRPKTFAVLKPFKEQLSRRRVTPLPLFNPPPPPGSNPPPPSSAPMRVWPNPNHLIQRQSPPITFGGASAARGDGHTVHTLWTKGDGAGGGRKHDVLATRRSEHG